MMKKLLILLTLSASYISVCSQTRHSGWLASFNTFKTGKRTSIHADVQLRSTDEIRQVQTILLRAGLNFHVNKQLIVTGGYAYVRNKQTIASVNDFVTEHRVWEQLLYNHRLKPLYISHRFRLEQRFLAVTSINNNEIETDRYTMTSRFRYFIRNILPFKKTDSFKKGFFGAVQNEVFVNLTDKDKVNGKFFDQNRFYLAAGYRLNASFDLEAGYLNQYILGKNGHTNNHVVQLASYLRL